MGGWVWTGLRSLSRINPCCAHKRAYSLCLVWLALVESDSYRQPEEDASVDIATKDEV